MVLCKVVLRSASLGEELFFNIRVNADFSWHIMMLGKLINPITSPYLQQFPQFVMSVDDIECLIRKLDAARVCVGNGDDKFSLLSEKNQGSFKSSTGIN